MYRRVNFIFLTLLLVSVACTNHSVDPTNEPTPIPEPTSPANVLLALERLYEDTDRGPAERAQAFAELLAPLPGDENVPAFTFRYGMCDIECPWQEWGYTEEVKAHQNMFRQVHRLDLDLNASPDYDFTIIAPDRQGWRVIHSESVKLRVWLNETEFIERHTAEQYFIFASVSGRWYLADWWEDLSPTMWGDFKREFLTDEK